MTGIRSFDPRLLLGLLPVVWTFAKADDLTLAGDARLTGTVRSIDEKGVVELVSSLSSEPLRLMPGAVGKVEFTSPSLAGDPPAALVELTNGDLLPATVEGLDEKNLFVTTTHTGPLTIPRGVVNSLQLGVSKRKVIYSGPKNLGEWNIDGGGAKNWTFASKSLAANGPAHASKYLEMPRRFILKFTLKWVKNPNFLIYFADPLKSGNEPGDRYFFQFNGAGMEIKRHSSKGLQVRTVMLLPRTPDQFESSQVEVEIRVDRETSRFQLLLNGESEGAGVDTAAEPPTGGGVTITNSSPSGNAVQVFNIQLLELDNTRVRHRAEDRGDVKTDSLISRDEDRWGGHLVSIRKEAEGGVFLFKSDFQEEPLELLESEVSTLFFAHAEGSATASEQPFVLRLRDEGSLRLSSCVLSEDAVTAVHPLLGTMKIGRAGIAALERPGSQPVEKPEE